MSTTKRTAREWFAALAAAVVIVAIIVGLPIVLLAVGANPVPSSVPSIPSMQSVWESFTRQDDGTLVLAVIKVVSWLAWLFLTVSILVEVVSQLRGVRAPRLPGLQVPQAAARGLVAAAILLFVGAPVLALVPGPAHASPAASSTGGSQTTSPSTVSPALTVSHDKRVSAAGGGHAAHTASAKATRSPESSAAQSIPTVRHVVQPGESMWSVAQTYLGDGSRYPEIAAMNPQLVGPKPGFLRTGWVLTVPATAPGRTPAAGAASTSHAYTVQTGDTLSEIAERQLGDASAYPLIAQASRDITQPGGAHLQDPDRIYTGWTLAIPDENPADSATDSPAAAVAPPPAADPPVAGSPATGGTPSAPILPATPVPVTSAPAVAGVTPRAPDRDESRPGAEGETETPAGATAPSPSSASSVSTVAPSGSAGSWPDTAVSTPSVMPWLLTGLCGAGALLGGAMVRMLAIRRRTQLRSRRPGRAVAAPSPQLVPVEKTLAVAGEPATEMVERLDAVLRRVAAAHARDARPMPALAAIQTHPGSLSLHLSEPAVLDAPWRGSGDGLVWTLPADVDLDDVGPAVPDQPAPYPLLVSIGSTNDSDHTDDFDDHDGRDEAPALTETWLLNLEQVGTVAVTGDETFGLDFIRHLAAQIACNPWSDAVTVDCVGVAEEVPGMNQQRVRVATDKDTLVAAALADAADTVDRTTELEADAATARARQLDLDAWPARLVLVDVERYGTTVSRLLTLVDAHPGRTGTAVIGMIPGVVRGAGHSGGPIPPSVVGPDWSNALVVQLTGRGRVLIPEVGLDLVAVGLTPDEALGCAQLLAQSEELQDVEMPRLEGARGWRVFADEAGALRPEHTVGRDAGSSTGRFTPTASLLEGPDEEYTSVAATTTEDLRQLAPRVEPATRRDVEDADPDLDANLDAWHSESNPLPRLRLLGPVTATTRGQALTKRKAYYTEMLAFLATRPHGATPGEVAEAFSLSEARVRTDIKIVRDWLGRHPRTGQPYLPNAKDGAAARARGVGVYEVTGLLVDADLFRRLRVRGDARGADEGIGDYRAALRLVSGPPLSGLRPNRWSWLFEGDRLDFHLQHAVVDVAHVVTTHALRAGDLPAAQAAAELACNAAPYEDTPALDLAAVYDAQGRHSEAQRIRAEVCNRSDDDSAPDDLPTRTQAILDAKTWLTQRPAS